jgi:outer membrane protein OmpA-like peptidoglycan-associated protein
MDESEFYKDSSLYRINYMYPLNSRQSDFSPMYHEGGLVFVSARDEGGIIKRVFMQNETPFLDLFQFPDTTLLIPKEKELQSRTASLSSYGESDDPREIEAFEKEAKDLPKTEEFSRTLNTKYHEGPVSFFSDHQKLIFTRNSYNKGLSHKSKDGLIMLKLYESTFDGKKWGDVKPLPFNSDDYSCGHPAITADDSRMYFVSDMKGGYGGTDIYKVDYIDGEWSAPMNLGKEINTEGNEMFPYVDASDDLYFASDGHAGLGGLDIFFVDLENGIPTEEPQNLGHPINSSRDDFGLITDANRGSGFFSSNRRRGYSDDNIYHFTRKCRELRVLVYDAKTKKPIVNADVRLVKNGVNQNLLISDEEGAVQVCMETMTNFEFQATKSGYQKNSVSYGTMSTSQRNKTEIKVYLEQTKSPIISGTVVSEVNGKPLSGATVTLRNERDGSEEKLTTGEDGHYVFQPEKDGKYSVSVLKERYATNSEYLGKVKKNRDESTYQRNIGMIGEGDIFKIDNIYYDLDKYAIRSDAAQELSNKLLPVLQKYLDIQIEIGSHTDSRATDSYNLRLSQQRASAVVDYLIRNGIDRNRLIARGYGENEIINECLNGVSCNEYKHQENRRTEFKVLTVGNYIGKK